VKAGATGMMGVPRATGNPADREEGGQKPVNSQILQAKAPNQRRKGGVVNKMWNSTLSKTKSRDFQKEGTHPTKIAVNPVTAVAQEEGGSNQSLGEREKRMCIGMTFRKKKIWKVPAGC